MLACSNEHLATKMKHQIWKGTLPIHIVKLYPFMRRKNKIEITCALDPKDWVLQHLWHLRLRMAIRCHLHGTRPCNNLAVAEFVEAIFACAIV